MSRFKNTANIRGISPLRCEMTAVMVAWCGQRRFYPKHDHHNSFQINVMPIVRNERGIPLGMAVSWVNAVSGKGFRV
ncbi:MAG: hypothetical protein RIF36_11445 [Imperialibacter sp.]|uniref:hypothetical protein n=1 Tax=Imperialibacter sp. TaxID=2038411 RepID=UPI0032ED1A09